MQNWSPKQKLIPDRSRPALPAWPGRRLFLSVEYDHQARRRCLEPVKTPLGRGGGTQAFTSSIYCLEKTGRFLPRGGRERLD